MNGLEKAAEQGIGHYLVPRFTRTVQPFGQEKLPVTHAYERLRRNENRNGLIVADVKKALEAGRTPVILTRFTDQAAILYEKYKGWYCGNKSQSVDYRTKRNILLDESEWVTYPDPSIPAIVPEELWNRANALYKRRREEMKSHSSGLSFHNRYPYSAKIYCEEHGTTFHRQVIQTKKGQQEVWQCKVYRSHGWAACSAPQIRSSDLDFILSDIFKELIRDKQKIIDSLVTVLTNIPKEVDYGKLRCQVENEMDDLERKKNRLLDLSIAGALTVEEFKERNDAFNVQILECHGKLTAIRQEENQPSEELDIPAIRQALDEALRFTGEIDTALVATILDKVVVKKESTKDAIHLDIFLKLGSTYEAVYTPPKHTAGITSLKNITRKQPIRRT